MWHWVKAEQQRNDLLEGNLDELIPKRVPCQFGVTRDDFTGLANKLAANELIVSRLRQNSQMFLSYELDTHLS